MKTRLPDWEFVSKKQLPDGSYEEVWYDPDRNLLITSHVNPKTGSSIPVSKKFDLSKMSKRFRSNVHMFQLYLNDPNKDWDYLDPEIIEKLLDGYGQCHKEMEEKGFNDHDTQLHRLAGIPDQDQINRLDFISNGCYLNDDEPEEEEVVEDEEEDDFPIPKKFVPTLKQVKGAAQMYTLATQRALGDPTELSSDVIDRLKYAFYIMYCHNNVVINVSQQARFKVGKTDVTLYTPEMIEQGVLYHHLKLKDVPPEYLTDKVLTYAVVADGSRLANVPPDKRTPFLCRLGVQHDPSDTAYHATPDRCKTREWWLDVMFRHPRFVVDVPTTMLDDAFIDEAMDRSVNIFKYITQNRRTVERCVKAVKQNPDWLNKYVPSGKIRTKVEELLSKQPQ